MLCLLFVHRNNPEVRDREFILEVGDPGLLFPCAGVGIQTYIFWFPQKGPNNF